MKSADNSFDKHRVRFFFIAARRLGKAGCFGIGGAPRGHAQVYQITPKVAGFSDSPYDHDAFVVHLEQNGLIGADSVTWHQAGGRSWPSPPSWAIKLLSE